MSFSYDFNDTTFRAIAFDLPVFDYGLLAVKGRHPTHPKNARSKMILSRSVIDKQQLGFATEQSHIEIIVHKHEDIYIVVSMAV